MHLTLVILCGLFVQAKTDLCSDNVTMYELPTGPLTSFLTVYNLGGVMRFTDCPKNSPVNPNKIVFWLFNKQNRKTPIRLSSNDVSAIDPTQKIVFIVHGWTCNITGEGLPEMKDAYLTRYPDSNIVFIEWATYAIDAYMYSFCNLPKIAEIVGRFICNLSYIFNVDLRRLHLVGHSLGAQLAGLTGQEIQQKCNSKIGRITALDPAGPFYQVLPEHRRLDASDATIVDVIHTSQITTGYYGQCGTVDYYPNCGYFQPGCIPIPTTSSISEFLNLPYKMFVCSHMRSIYYFTESILSNNFKATSCTLCPGSWLAMVCVKDLFFASTSKMGEGYDPHTGRAAKYYLNTNSQPPYALG